MTTLALSFANAQEKAADPYKTDDTQAAKESRLACAPNISICYEDFSLPLAMAATLQHEKLTDAELYAKVRSALGTDAVRQETFTVLRAKSGQKAKTESVTEIIYPTEYEPAEISDAATGAAALPTQRPVNILSAPATPTAFDTRNVGFALEIETTLYDGDKKLDIRLTPEHVTLVGQSTAGQDISKTEMPIFEAQRVITQAVLELDVPYLLGTINLPVTSKQDPDSAKRVWFAFLTGTLSK